VNLVTVDGQVNGLVNAFRAYHYTMADVDSMSELGWQLVSSLARVPLPNTAVRLLCRERFEELVIWEKYAELDAMQDLEEERLAEWEQSR